MLRLLQDRRSGLSPPRLLERAIMTQRVFSLSLSRTEELVPLHTDGVMALAVDSVSGRFLLTGGCDQRIGVYDLGERFTPSGSHRRLKHIAVTSKKAHKYAVSGLRWYPHDTGIFVSGSMDGNVRVWDTNRLEVVETFDGFGAVYAHDVSPAALVAVGSRLTDVILCDLRTGSRAHRLRGHRGAVVALQWAPGREYQLATAGSDARVLLWDIRRARSCLRSFDQHNGETVSSLDTITAHNAAVNGLVYTSDGQHLVTSGRDGRARLWDADTGAHLNINYPGIHNSSHKRLDFALSDAGSIPLLIHPNGRDIAVYDLFTGRRTRTLRAHYGSVHSVLLHPFRTRMFSAADDNEVLIWEPPPPKELSEDHPLGGRPTAGGATTNTTGEDDGVWADVAVASNIDVMNDMHAHAHAQVHAQAPGPSAAALEPDRDNWSDDEEL